jgi:Holliday junction resolvasome RuvABC endonuclease subunit
MKYCGIDLSLVNSGLVIIDSDAKILTQRSIFSSPKFLIEARLITIGRCVFDSLYEHSPNVIYIEGLAFGARGQSMLQLAALHYYVRVLMYGEEIIFSTISPTEVKKFVTGKGTAKKELMLLKTFKRWGASFDDNNLCDAYCLARYALHKERPKTKSRRRI